MRSKPTDDDVLEPLPVFDEGGRHDPVPARAPVTAPDVRVLAHECLSAVREVIGERATVRSQTPWAPAPPVPRPSAGRWGTTFTRMISVHPSQLPDLPRWWRARARDGRIRITSRLWFEQPRPAARGVWRARGRLRSRWWLRSIPVELVLWPHLGSWTKLNLEPRRAVHAGQPYFRKGHRVLDVLTERLARELRC